MACGAELEIGSGEGRDNLPTVAELTCRTSEGEITLRIARA